MNILTKELLETIPRLPKLLDKYWSSLLIDKYPPVIHRLYYKLAEERTIILHKLYNTKGQKALMHNHSWPFAIKVLSGGYEMGVGYSKYRNNPPEASMTVQVKAGDIYTMEDENMWHYTKPLENEVSYSIMLIGKRIRERKSENNESLNDREVNILKNEFKILLGLESLNEGSLYF